MDFKIGHKIVISNFVGQFFLRGTFIIEIPYLTIRYINVRKYGKTLLM